LIAPRKPGLAFPRSGAIGFPAAQLSTTDAYKRAGYVDAATEVQRLWLDGKREEATGAGCPTSSS